MGGSPEGGEGGAGVTEAAKRGREGTERGRETEVKGRSSLPSGWAESTESRSSS